jgi:molybdopterin-guanine dinucleotide biosynthesis protein A
MAPHARKNGSLPPTGGRRRPWDGPAGGASEPGRNAPPARADITGLVLAGGRALRMGGAAKGLAELRGETLIARVIARLRPQVTGLLINANRPDYAALGLPLIADVVPDYAGPLAGLHAGLLACPTTWLVTVPCDAPFVATDLVARLAQAASRQHRLLVAVSPRGVEPGFMLVRVDLAAALGDWLAGGGRKVRDWLAAAGATEVAFADADAFANINTPEELATLNALRPESVAGGLAQGPSA